MQPTSPPAADDEPSLAFIIAATAAPGGDELAPPRPDARRLLFPLAESMLSPKNLNLCQTAEKKMPGRLNINRARDTWGRVD